MADVEETSDRMLQLLVLLKKHNSLKSGFCRWFGFQVLSEVGFLPCAP